MAAYLALREQITVQAAHLAKRYAAHLRCCRGCSFCCDAIEILPIEREALREWRARAGRRAKPVKHTRIRPAAEQAVDRTVHGTFPASGGSTLCAMLDAHGACTVYEARPVICRTHGLPLAYRVYEYDMLGQEVRPEQPEYTDLWCARNFRSLDESHATAYFDANGRINMDSVNREIESLNASFLGSSAGAAYAAQPQPVEADPADQAIPPVR